MSWRALCALCVRDVSGSKVSVMPRRPVKGASKWLLKMHGCVSEPHDIVLTRCGYVGACVASRA